MTYRGRAPLVLLLSGASSSGKMSIAKALQHRMPIPAVLIEADRAFPDLPARHPQWMADRRSHSNAVIAFHRSVVAWAEQGFNLIVDGSLPFGDASLREECLRTFKDVDLRVVGVICNRERLVEREKARGDRVAGWATEQAATVNEGIRPSATVDTSERTPDDCADVLIRELRIVAR